LTTSISGFSFSSSSPEPNRGDRHSQGRNIVDKFIRIMKSNGGFEKAVVRKIADLTGDLGIITI
jgi:hypothetical protein